MVGEVVIPDAVYDDLIVKGKGRPGAAELQGAAWIQRKTLTDRTPLASLPAYLHAGEAETIILGEEMRLPLLIDERRGRKVALDRRIDVVGSLGILGQAKRRGLIPQVKPLVGALLATGYWIDEELVPAFLQEVGET